MQKANRLYSAAWVCMHPGQPFTLMPAARMGVFLVLITRNHHHDWGAYSNYMYISVGVGEILAELQ